MQCSLTLTFFDSCHKNCFGFNPFLFDNDSLHIFSGWILSYDLSEEIVKLIVFVCQVFYLGKWT